MKYLPFEHIIYTSHLHQEKVIEILSRSVGEKTVRIFKNGPAKEYEGIVNGNRFTISRIFRGRNSFQPQITGMIQQHTIGTRIEIKMQLSVFVLIFSLFWCFTVTGFLIADIRSANVSYIDVLVSMGMLLFFYLMAMLGFKTESKKSKEFFEKLLDAEIVSEK